MPDACYDFCDVDDRIGNRKALRGRKKYGGKKGFPATAVRRAAVEKRGYPHAQLRIPRNVIQRRSLLTLRAIYISRNSPAARGSCCGASRPRHPRLPCTTAAHLQ